MTEISDLRPWRASGNGATLDEWESWLAGPGRMKPDESGAWWAWPLEFAGRACCCPARPTVVVVMPPAGGRLYPVDLLLCAHHYRASLLALLAAGAAVYDAAGTVIPAVRAVSETLGAH